MPQEGPFPRRQSLLGRAFCLPARFPGQRAEGKRDGKNIERARRRQLSRVLWFNGATHDLRNVQHSVFIGRARCRECRYRHANRGLWGFGCVPTSAVETCLGTRRGRASLADLSVTLGCPGKSERHLAIVNPSYVHWQHLLRSLGQCERSNRIPARCLSTRVL